MDNSSLPNVFPRKKEASFRNESRDGGKRLEVMLGHEVVRCPALSKGRLTQRDAGVVKIWVMCKKDFVSTKIA